MGYSEGTFEYVFDFHDIDRYHFGEESDGIEVDRMFGIGTFCSNGYGLRQGGDFVHNLQYVISGLHIFLMSLAIHAVKNTPCCAVVSSWKLRHNGACHRK